MIAMWRTIGFRLTLAVGITTIVIIGVYAYFNIRAHSDDLLNEVERHANQVSETIKKGTRFDMLANRPEHIYNIINAIGEEPGFQKIRVLNKGGEVIYSADATDIGRMLDKQAESCYACHTANKPLERLPFNQRTRIYRSHPDSARVLGVINPIYNEPACWQAPCHAHAQEQTVLGVLDITMDLGEVDAEIKRGATDILILALIAIAAISFIVGFFVTRWVAHPVHEMVAATQHIASGNLHYRIKNHRDDELGLLAASFNNMTVKLAEARLQLFQSDKMASLGRLAAGVAHEINNPLTGILTYSSFLLKRAKDDPELRDDLKVIMREAIRSREIVKSLLDFARQSVPKKSNVDIIEIIDHSVAVVANQLSINKVRVTKQFDGDNMQILADSNQMQQVLINLLSNAADAMAEHGGTVAISAALIRLPPVGMVQIKSAICPKGHSLMDNQVRIAGKASVRVKAKSSYDNGMVYLDPVYGMTRHRYELRRDDDHGLQFSCPTCNRSLLEEGRSCPECNSAIYAFEVTGHGRLEGCSRKDCDWQRWEQIDRAGPRDYLEIRVEDEGRGIDERDLTRIFDPFYTTKGQKGTGLGLAVSWGIVDNHNGTIQVESTLGAGTAFTIRLPVGDLPEG